MGTTKSRKYSGKWDSGHRELSLDHFKKFEPEKKTELLLKLYTQQTHKLHKFSYNLVATTLGVFLR